MGDSVSDLFCREKCQKAWAARRVGAAVEPVSPFEHFPPRFHPSGDLWPLSSRAEVFVAPVDTSPGGGDWSRLGTADAPVTMGMDLTDDIATASVAYNVDGVVYVDIMPDLRRPRRGQHMEVRGAGEPERVTFNGDRWVPTEDWTAALGTPSPADLLAAQEFVRASYDILISRVNATVQDLTPALNGTAAAIRSAWQAAAANITAFVEAGVVEKPLPADPQARALALRKRRNTGPQQQRRAPRAINPRSTR